MQLGTIVPPDAMFGYSAEQAYQTLAAEGEGGQRVHRLFQIIDLLLIPVYTALYATAIAYGAQRLSDPWRRLLATCLFVPVLGGVVDYAEDASLLMLLSAYPDRLPTLATVAGGLTLAKWVLVYASLALTIAALLGAAIQTWRARQAYQQGMRLDLDEGRDENRAHEDRVGGRGRSARARARAV
jgi:hypothetical protein